MFYTLAYNGGAIRHDSSLAWMTFPRILLFTCNVKRRKPSRGVVSRGGTEARASVWFQNHAISHSLDDKTTDTPCFMFCVKYPSVQHLCDSLFADRLIVALMCFHIVQANTENPDKSSKVSTARSAGWIKPWINTHPLSIHWTDSTTKRSLSHTHTHTHA